MIVFSRTCFAKHYPFSRRQTSLEVNQQNTTICRPVNFNLLGHGYVARYRKGDKGKYRLCINKSSWKRLKEKIKVITRKTSPIAFEEHIKKLNYLMRGWLNYFRHATEQEKLRYLDAWIRCRLRYCIWKAWKKLNDAFELLFKWDLVEVGDQIWLFSNEWVGNCL